MRAGVGTLVQPFAQRVTRRFDHGASICEYSLQLNDRSSAVLCRSSVSSEAPIAGVTVIIWASGRKVIACDLKVSPVYKPLTHARALARVGNYEPGRANTSGLSVRYSRSASRQACVSWAFRPSAIFCSVTLPRTLGAAQRNSSHSVSISKTSASDASASTDSAYRTGVRSPAHSHSSGTGRSAAGV